MAASRYLEHTKKMPRNKIEETLNNMEHNILKKTLAQNLGEWESILKGSSEDPIHFKKQQIQNYINEQRKKYVKKLIKYHQLKENNAVRMIEEKKRNIIGEIPPKTKNEFLQNYRNILQQKKNSKLPYNIIESDRNGDNKRYVKYLVDHLDISVPEAKQIIKNEKNSFFTHKFYYGQKHGLNSYNL